MKKKLHEGPIQYQRGWTEFFKLKYKLTPDVLIPRPETELLVDEVISKNPQTVIDVGTGSGVIAISVAKNLKTVKVLAIDISPKALEVAKKNAKFQNVEKRVFFLESNLLENIEATPDVIVANLPYIPTPRLMYLDPMVVEFEPKIALDGGFDGFDLYRKLFSQILQKKIIPKFLICEIDSEHSSLAEDTAKRYFPEAKVEVKKDLAKMDRILVVRF